MDFGWLIALSISLGVISLSFVISNHFQVKKTKTIIVLSVIFIAVIYNLVLSNHAYWGRVYDDKEAEA